MKVRSSSSGEYRKRMAFVVLLGLAAYAVVISEKGGGATFKVWRPDRMRFAAIVLALIGVAAYEFRPRVDEQPKADEKNEPEEMPAPSDSSDALGADADTPSEPGHSSASEKSVRSSSASWQAARPSERITVAVPVPEQVGEFPADAEEAWQKARDMPHNFVPDADADAAYLKLVRRAAELGHTLAMVKLGDYAFRSGWIVEAYYWTLLAQLKGAPGLEHALGEIRKVWTLEGNPPEYENVRPDFSETQGVFSRAVLRLKCGLDAPLARRRLQELREARSPEALLFLASKA